MTKALRRQIGEKVFLSYLEAAPDHGGEEVALVDYRGHRSRLVVLARGPRAREVFETWTLEEALAVGEGW